jgi:hypothetical protein
MSADPTPPQSPIKQFFFDVNDIPKQTNEELLGDWENAEELFDLVGRDLETQFIVMTDKLSVSYETAKPGEAVKPHRHGTYQVDYVLKGSLFFGNREVTAGQGFFSPDMLYSWKAGPEGAEWLEIHSGIGGMFSDRGEE